MQNSTINASVDLQRKVNAIELHDACLLHRDHSFTESLTESDPIDIERFSIAEYTIDEETIAEKAIEEETLVDENEQSSDSSSKLSILSVHEMIQRLARITGHQGTGTVKRKMRPMRTISIEQLTTIIRHINLCDEKGKTPRWDMIEDMAYGPPKFEWASGAERPSPRRYGRTPDDHSQDSGYTIDAMPRSCTSSVTWYEGSNIEEVEVSDDDVLSSSCDVSQDFT